MCAILQMVSAPLNPIPIAEQFRRSHPQCEHSYGQHIYMYNRSFRFALPAEIFCPSEAKMLLDEMEKNRLVTDLLSFVLERTRLL